MRIPLDYYRILGLPIQATSEQLRQAHRDRTLQLPRREYSDAAISARKQLLDQAFAVLSNPDERRNYDSGFLAKTYDLGAEASSSENNPTRMATSDDPIPVDPHTPSIEIEDEQFIGALLILQELGEYELVLKLGRPYLTGGNASLKNRQYGDPTIVFSDIVLTVALACLELGREQWQQGQYENAAEALETGQQLLLREGLFANVRGEVQSDIYRLRPYRILELLSLPEEYFDARRTGMELLEEMLEERGGIDGTENDHSGLNIEDFLKFIQQLRSYLTAQEQQYLFEQESQRPSAVASYLTVYALLARGFAERQPELIYQAKQSLAVLANRQDVNLERAICSLLLGQTDAASQALEKSQEEESIAFIRQHSHQSPDLLPGLCLYTERWFHDEVFPHFRDLSNCKTSLKDYFADPQVPAYLEAIPDELETVPEQPVLLHTAPSRNGAVSQRNVNAAIGEKRYNDDAVPSANRAPNYQSGYSEQEDSADHDDLIAVAKARIASRNSATMGVEPRFSGGVSTAERVSQSALEEDEMKSDSESKVRSLRPRKGQAVNRPGSDKAGLEPSVSRKVPSKPRSKTRPWLMPLGVLLSVFLLGILGAWLVRSLRPSDPAAVQSGDELLVQLDQPLVTLEEEAIDPTTATTIDQETAKQLISNWLAAKAKAMGSTHDVAALDQILTDPKLSEWRNSSEQAKQEGWYRNYKHEIAVESVELLSASGQVITPPTESAPGTETTSRTETQASPTPSPDANANPAPEATTSPLPSPAPNVDAQSSPAPQDTTAQTNTAPVPEQAIVTANVTETSELFRDGKAAGATETDQLRVQYRLIRKDGKWRIQDWQI